MTTRAAYCPKSMRRSRAPLPPPCCRTCRLFQRVVKKCSLVSHSWRKHERSSTPSVPRRRLLASIQHERHSRKPLPYSIPCKLCQSHLPARAMTGVLASFVSNISGSQNICDNRLGSLVFANPRQDEAMYRSALPRTFWLQRKVKAWKRARTSDL